MTRSLVSWVALGSLLCFLLVVGNAASASSAAAAAASQKRKAKFVPPGMYFYDSKDSHPILEYKGNHDNAKKGDFTKSKKPCIVYFYGATCPACQLFKDQYIQLAKKVRATPGGENIEFYGVSCLVHQNICQSDRFKDIDFPSLVALSSGEGTGSKTLAFKRSYKASDIFEALEIPVPPGIAKSSKANARMTSLTESLAARKLEEKNAEDKPEEKKEETPDEGKVSEKNGETDNDDKKNDVDEKDGDDKVDSGARGNGSKSVDDDAKQVKTAKAALKKNTGIEDAEENTDDEAEDEAEDALPAPPSGKDVPPELDKPIRLDGDQGAEPSEEVNESTSDSGPLAATAVKREADVKRQAAADVLPLKTKQNAVLAAAKFKQDMDRWKEVMKEKRKQIEGRQGRFGGPRASVLSTVSGEAVPAAGGLTTTMKSLTKGTKEYENRRKAMLKLIEKVKKRRMQRETGKTLSKDAIFVKGNFPFKVEARQQNFMEKQLSTLPFFRQYFNFKPEEENVLDASVSFIHGLKYGVYEVRDQPLPPKKKRALKNWLDLLAVSLPPEWGIHTTIEELRSNIDSIAQHDSNLERILDKSPLARLTWSKSCSKGKMSAGFSCGFWKLLHIMTIGVAEHRGGLNLIQSGVVSESARVFSPSQAADVWRNYMAEFYSCTECRTEFLNQYDSCMFRRCERLKEDAETVKVADWKELAKYAWEFHNAVSLRVAENRAKAVPAEFSKKKKKKSADIKAIFPTIEQCLACFKDDGSWNEDAVFLFLEKTYWSGGSVLDPKISRFLRYDKTSYYRTSQFRILWWMTLAALAILVTMRRQINKAGLQQSMVAASSIMSRHVVARTTGGKMRSN